LKQEKGTALVAAFAGPEVVDEDADAESTLPAA